MKKKFVCFLLVFVLAFTPLLFAGCGIDVGEDGEISGGTSGGNSSGGQSTGWLNKYVDGFRVVYTRDMATGRTGRKQVIDDMFYFESILNPLTSIYGYNNDDSNCFPDSIRHTIVEKDGKLQITKNNGWSWTLDPNDSNISVSEIYNIIINNQLTEFNNLLSRGDLIWNKYPKLSDFYGVPIQIVIYECLLGYEDLTTFEAKTETVDELNGATIIDGVPYNHKKTTFKIYVKNCPSNKDLNGKRIYINELYFYEKDGKAVSVNESYKSKIKQEQELVEKEKKLVVDYLGDYNEETYTGSGLQFKYYSNATYSGFTKADANKFINYLLNEVIGSDEVDYDYENHYGKNQNVNYRNYVGTIARMVYEKVYDGEEGYVFTYTTKNGDKITYNFDEDDAADKTEGTNTFRATPSSYLSDYETEAFFGNDEYLKNMFEGNETSATSFENSPLAEYQSLIMMYKQNYTFGGMWMQIFSQNPELDMNLLLRFYAYDPKTQTGALYTIKQEGINFYHDNPIKYKGEPESVYVEGKGYLYKATEKDNDGKKIEGYYTDFMINVDITGIPAEFVQKAKDDQDIDYLKVDKFGKGDVMADAIETPYGRKQKSLEDAKNYKVISSQNGFGGVIVLDERKVDFSFCEVVFDTKKELFKDEDYTCKLAMILPF